MEFAADAVSAGSDEVLRGIICNSLRTRAGLVDFVSAQ